MCDKKMKVVVFSNGKYAELFLKCISKIKNISVVLICSDDELKLDGADHLMYQENSSNIAAKLSEYEFDYVLVYGWRYYINKSILSKFEVFNFHPSMLPLFRGPRPLEVQLVHGVRKSGMTMYRVDEKYDAGPIYRQVEFCINENDNLHSLQVKIHRSIVSLLNSFVEDFQRNDIQLLEQDHDNATYT